MQAPDSKPGSYYVSLIRGGRTALLAGPFSEHATALALLEPARHEASRVDPWSDFDAIGTCRMPIEYDRPGALTVALGLLQDRGSSPDGVVAPHATDCRSPKTARLSNGSGVPWGASPSARSGYGTTIQPAASEFATVGNK